MQPTLAPTACTNPSNFLFYNLAPAGPLGTNSYTFQSAPSVSVIAYGFLISNKKPVNLVVKTNGIIESGIGLVDDSFAADTNIDANHIVQLDVDALISVRSLTGPQLFITSLQSGQGYKLYGSNVLGAVGTLLSSGYQSGSTKTASVSIPSFGSYRYIGVTATSGDILLSKLYFDCRTNATKNGESAIVNSSPIASFESIAGIVAAVLVLMVLLSIMWVFRGGFSNMIRGGKSIRMDAVIESGTRMSKGPVEEDI